MKMLKKSAFGIILSLILLFTLMLANRTVAQDTMLQGWTIENGGCSCSSPEDGTIKLWSSSHDMGDYTNCPSINLVKEVVPSTDFNFSASVRRDQTANYVIAMILRMNSTYALFFEFGHFGVPKFHLARTSNATWIYNAIGNGKDQTWYNLQLNVHKNPFTVEAKVSGADGTDISYSVFDMSFSFEDITAFGFILWGYDGGCSIKNIVDPFSKPTFLSISANSLSTQTGSAVNIVGRLTDSNGTPLPDRPIVLSYTFPAANGWTQISSAFTNDAGEYAIQWVSSASGTFTLRTEWSGDALYLGASNATTLSFLPYQSQQVFIVESNSTVTQLAFNSTDSKLSFTVSGEPGTIGFVKATLAKSLITNDAGLEVFLDGNQLNYSLKSTDESWLLLFTYSHSTHNVAVYMGPNAPLQSPSPSPTLSPSPAPTLSLIIEPTSTPRQQTGFLGTNLPVEYGYAIVSVLVIILVAGLSLFCFKKLRKH